MVGVISYRLPSIAVIAALHFQKLPDKTCAMILQDLLWDTIKECLDKEKCLAI